MSRPVKKIGLALGGGGARGAALIGVIEELNKEKIPIDFISGSSIGSLAAAAYAVDNLEGSKKISNSVKKRDMVALADFFATRGGLMQGAKIRQIIDQITLNKNFNETKIPLAMVATDIDKIERVVIREGSLSKAAMASSCIPGLISPVKIDNRNLIDGGLVDMLPSDILYEMGADYVIAVNIRAHYSHPIVHLGRLTGAQIDKIKARLVLWEYYLNEIKKRLKGNSAIINNKVYQFPESAKKIKKNSHDKSFNFFNIAIFSYLTVVKGIAASKFENIKCDMLLSPDLKDVGRGEFYKSKICINAGKKAVQEKISQIKKDLEVL